MIGASVIIVQARIKLSTQQVISLTINPFLALLNDPALLMDPLFFIRDTLNASGLGRASSKVSDSEKVGE